MQNGKNLRSLEDRNSIKTHKNSKTATPELLTSYWNGKDEESSAREKLLPSSGQRLGQTSLIATSPPTSSLNRFWRVMND